MRSIPAHVTHRLAALRENAFELHAALSVLMRESAEQREELGMVEAVMAPHRLVASRSAVRR